MQTSCLWPWKPSSQEIYQTCVFQYNSVKPQSRYLMSLMYLLNHIKKDIMRIKIKRSKALLRQIVWEPECSCSLSTVLHIRMHLFVLCRHVCTGLTQLYVCPAKLSALLLIQRPANKINKSELTFDLPQAHPWVRLTALIWSKWLWLAPLSGHNTEAAHQRSVATKY